MKNKSGFLTLCFSFVPGAGQMYQGYMRRGVSVLLAFCAAFWLTWFMDAFSVLMGVVWMVSFFDSLNLRSRILSGIAEGRNAPMRVVHIESAQQAQSAPCPFTTFSLFYDGELVTHEILSEKKFEKILDEKGY